MVHFCPFGSFLPPKRKLFPRREKVKKFQKWGQFSTKRAKMNHAKSFVRCVHGSSDYVYTFYSSFNIQKKNNRKWFIFALLVENCPPKRNYSHEEKI